MFKNGYNIYKYMNNIFGNNITNNIIYLIIRNKFISCNNV